MMALNPETLGLAAEVTPAGISAPDYPTILSRMTDYFRQIYGEDAYLDPDSKDGQMLALYALGIHDANNAAIAVYNAFSPVTASGRALSNNVKINGIARKGASYSSVDVVLTGEVGTLIASGSLRDENGQLWDLPTNITIPVSGSITVTAVCQAAGAVPVRAGALNQIATPTRGWYSATNPLAATPGEAVESDAELRQRQSRSTALASRTTADGLDGALLNIDGVSRVRIYENDSDISDDNGLPPHSISCIVDGGDATQIAETLSARKDQGTSTWGTTQVTVTGRYGEQKNIRFSRPVSVPIYVHIELAALPGYSSQTAQAIKEQVVTYINGLGIGESLLLSRLYSPANLGVMSGGDSRYYDIRALEIGKNPQELASASIEILFNEAAQCSAENIEIMVIA
jgi:uncharacterized phage protein gp47/JayE